MVKEYDQLIQEINIELGKKEMIERAIKQERDNTKKVMEINHDA